MIAKSGLVSALAEVHATERKSAWSDGVAAYAAELAENLADDLPDALPEAWEDVRELLLNGAASWTQYSFGCCSLVRDCDIAARLCCPSELRRVRGGVRPPNGRETWLGVQARALRAAEDLIRRAWRAASPVVVIHCR